MPVDIALQKAKLAFIATSRQYRLPYFWALLLLLVKQKCLWRKRKTPGYIFTVSIALAAGLSFFGWRKWKTRNQILYK